MGFKQSPHEVVVYRRGNGGNALLVGVYVDDLTTYAKRVIKLGGLTDCNPALTPMEERLKLSRDSMTVEVDATQYWRLVGNLRYLTHTRPDLAFSVNYVSRFMQRPTRFMQRPTTKHLQAVKRILRYVARTLDYSLHYPSWQSVKQQMMALSSYETEYIAASSALTQALWLA
ncbi:uncharacterized mitochondrial protein AtMg00810-like [Setaria viridis]|uniref:uncharacterized mitochondrial protein AtMg00810-like n=1 Tax=Setaria viridis TaxID=4556 RepID=UPI003B3BDCBB